MTKAQANEIFREINSDDYSENDKAIAIYEVVSGDVGRVTKRDMTEVIRWIWHQRYKWK